jgi:hypothetical protein
MPFGVDASEFLGRFQQGQEIPLRLQCVNAAGAADDPADVPRAQLWRDGSSPAFVETVELAADLRGVTTGFFRRGHFLGGLYANAGRYLVVFKWQDSGGTAHHRCASFVLNPGGSADGALVSVAYVERPDASYLLYGTDAGRLIRGRNPR